MTLRPGQVERRRARRRRHLAGIADAVDVAALDDDGLVRARRRAGAVDDANVGQRHDRCVDLDEGADSIAEL